MEPVTSITKNSLSKPPVVPASTDKKDLGFERQEMFGWFNPVDLLGIAVHVVLSSVFGNYADKRELQAALEKNKSFDYSDKDEIWFDYVADLGDGWNSTHTLARILAESELTVEEKTIKRGSFLVMGGDQVYPTATRDEYRNRTEGPYKAALPWSDEKEAPRLFALPGNHDWYDGLTSFSRLFCQQRWIGAWKTEQTRSYFAIKLPHDWWLLAVDIQLAADIDAPQLDYFDEVISQIQPGDKVIVVSAVPSWVFDALTGESNSENISFMEKRIQKQGGEIYVNLAGDLHHYAHYTDKQVTRHKITAGGGGAFLHGTHILPNEIDVNEAYDRNTYSLTENGLYPTKKTSLDLCKGCFKFPLRNVAMTVFLGIYFLFTLWVSQSASLALGYNLIQDLAAIPYVWQSLPTVITAFIQTLSHSPGSFVLFSLYILGFIAFCEPYPEKNKTAQAIKRVLWGASHGLVQMVLMCVLTFSFIHLNHISETLAASSILHNTALVAELFIVGSLSAGLILGAYLYLSVMLFNFHTETAFSCNRIENYKNFLRLHIASDGTATIYPIGVEQVEKHWQLNVNGKAGDPWFVPESGQSINDYTHLIEQPIVVQNTVDQNPKQQIEG